MSELALTKTIKFFCTYGLKCEANLDEGWITKLHPQEIPTIKYVKITFMSLMNDLD